MSQINVIELSNIKSINYKGLNKRSTENARWENAVDIDLKAGDQINIENAILNLRGISADSTIELQAADNEYGVSDSKVGMRFIPYVNDNGWNTVALPFVGSNREVSYDLKYYTDADYPKYPDLAVFQSTSFIPMYANVTNVNGVSPVNAGEPFTDENAFEFMYNEETGVTIEVDTMASPFKHNLKTCYAEKAANGSVSK